MAVTVPTNPKFDGGNDAAILIGHRDETRLNNKVELGDGREILDRTAFQAPGYAQEKQFGILSGTAKFSGYMPHEAIIVSAQLAPYIGKNRRSKPIMVAPSGFTLGYEAVFAGTKASDYDVDVAFGGITTAASAFATSESGLIDGFCVHSPHGASATGGNEVANLVFNGVNPAQYLGLRGNGVTGTGAGNIFSFRLSDYANDTALCAGIKAGLEALTIYSGRTVTVTVTIGRSTSNGLLSLVLRVEWSDAVNVVALEALQGALHVLTFNGATSTKTIYGTVNVDPTANSGAGTLASVVQTAVQAKAGQYANAQVTKSGTGGNSVYTFAYPIGATPGNLTAPTVPVNEVQTLSAPGVSAVVLNAQAGGTQQTINASDTQTVKATKVAANYGVTNGHIVIADSSVNPVNDNQFISSSSGYTGNGQSASVVFDSNLFTFYGDNSYRAVEATLSASKVVTYVRVVASVTNIASDYFTRLRFSGSNAAITDGNGGNGSTGGTTLLDATGLTGTGWTVIASGMPNTITISGTGTGNDGVYTSEGPGGTGSVSPRYKKGTNQYISFDPTANKWCLSTNSSLPTAAANSIYNVPGTLASVPTTGWVLGPNGSGTTPTVATAGDSSIDGTDKLYQRTFALTNSTGYTHYAVYYEWSTLNFAFRDITFYEGDPNGALTTAFTATFSGASVSGTNVAQMTSPTGGVTINTTTSGGIITDPQTSVSLLSAGGATVLSPVVLAEGGVSGLTYNQIVSSGQDTWIDFGSASARTEALLSVLNIAGTGATLTVMIDHADDNGGAPGTVTQACSFDVVTNTTYDYATQLYRAMTTSLKQWRRCRWTLTGTNAQVIFACAIAC